MTAYRGGPPPLCCKLQGGWFSKALRGQRIVLSPCAKTAGSLWRPSHPPSCPRRVRGCSALSVAGAAAGAGRGALPGRLLDRTLLWPPRTQEKILEGWKVYAGTTNLQQLPEAASIAQIIVHGNYTDEEDDYDIALIRLSKPLPLSGECAHPPARPSNPGDPCLWQ